MNFKYVIKKCCQCSSAYKLDPDRYFIKYCMICSNEEKELKQRFLDLRLKNYLNSKYRNSL